MKLPLVFALISLTGCTRAAPRPHETRYPALSQATNAVAPLRVEPDEGALPVTLPCTGAESIEPNGIDDNCDGQIDADRNEGNIAFSIAHDPRQDLSIELSENGRRVVPSSENDVGSCDSNRAFAVRSASFAKLPPGSYKIAVVRGTRCSSEDVKFVHVSLAAKSEAPVRFGRALELGSNTPVATLVVP